MHIERVNRAVQRIEDMAAVTSNSGEWNVAIAELKNAIKAHPDAMVQAIEEMPEETSGETSEETKKPKTPRKPKEEK